MKGDHFDPDSFSQESKLLLLKFAQHVSVLEQWFECMTLNAEFHLPWKSEFGPGSNVKSELTLLQLQGAIVSYCRC